jgi:hypothetical protein
MTPQLDEVWGRVGRELAHLSYERNRLTEDARQWHYEQIWRDIASAVDAFVLDASPERLPDGVRSVLSELASAEPADSDRTASTFTSYESAAIREPDLRG